MGLGAIKSWALAVGFALCVSACAGQAPEAEVRAIDPDATYGPEGTKDPYERWNKKVYRFNRNLDRKVLDPFISGYQKVVPGFVRTGLSNAFANLGEPLNFMHNTLQGSPDRAARNLGRFLFNSIFGLAGLIDVAGYGGIEPAVEDAGQTLGVWGVPTGPYVQLPFLGPNTIRSTFGFIIDGFANPFGYVVGGQFGVEVVSTNIPRPTINVFSIIQARDDFDEQVDTLFELEVDEGYTLARSGYLQQRCFAISNGALGSCEEEDDLFEDDFVALEPLQLDLIQDRFPTD